MKKNTKKTFFKHFSVCVCCFTFLSFFYLIPAINHILKDNQIMKARAEMLHPQQMKWNTYKSNIKVDKMVKFQLNFQISGKKKDYFQVFFCRKSTISKSLPHNDKDALNFLFHSLSGISYMVQLWKKENYLKGRWKNMNSIRLLGFANNICSNLLVGLRIWILHKYFGRSNRIKRMIVNIPWENWIKKRTYSDSKMNEKKHHKITTTKLRFELFAFGIWFVYAFISL